MGKTQEIIKKMSFFGDSYNEKKLKANLKLAINRLKLVEKKKTEIALRARKEISDYIKVNKIERSRIRVEHIIREDYLVEALEIIEMQCDLILARVALLGGKGKGNKVPHVSIHEAIDSILWAYPQISGDCQELKIVVGQLAILFGKQYVHEVQNKSGDENPHVNAKLVSRLDPSTPKAYIIETYLEAIAQAYDVEYQADPQVMAAYARQNAIKEEDLINVDQDFMPKPPNNFPGNPPQPPSNPGNSGGSYPINPSMPQPPQKQPTAFSYPSQPAQNNNQNETEFDPLPSGFLPPGNFNAPTSPAPQPPNNENPNSSAPLHGQIYDDGQNLNQAPNNDNNEIYQAPSIRGPSNTQQTSGYGKSKETEQPYNGGQ